MLEHYDAEFTLALARERAERLRGEASADRVARHTASHTGDDLRGSRRRARWGRDHGNLPPALR